MTTALVVLVAVVIGGGYIFWRVSQGQYYVGANSEGQVVIYRGISQRIAGFSWSSPYQLTGIPLAQVPSNYQQTVKTNYSTGSLNQVRQTVGNIQTAVDNCRGRVRGAGELEDRGGQVQRRSGPGQEAEETDGQHPQARPAAAPAPGDVPAARGVRHPGQCPAAGRLGVGLTGATGPRDAVRSR